MVEVGEWATAISNIIAEHGTSVSWKAATRNVSAVTGDEVISYAAPVTINVLFGTRLFRNIVDKTGRFERADAFIVANGSLAFGKQDLIEAGSTFEIRETEIKKWGGSGLFSWAFAYFKGE